MNPYKLIKKASNYALALGLVLNTSFIQGAALNIMPTPTIQKQLGEPETAIHYRNVPFYSQFRDIQLVKWQKLGCGIASLAMIIDFYKPNTVSVMKLLDQAIAAGAYQSDIGWKHKELSALAGNYGLMEESYDLSKLSNEAAFAKFLNFLADGPVVVSIHNKFNPQAALGHIVVVTGFENGVIFYNDPAGNGVERKISTSDFLKGWKKRFIVVKENPSV